MQNYRVTDEQLRAIDPERAAARDHGREDFRAGVKLKNNRYNRASKLHGAWCAGWRMERDSAS